MLLALELSVPGTQIGFICHDLIAGVKAYYGPSIFNTSGINATVVQLPVETFDTHNYLAAIDIVIAKAGWGTISEALLSKRNLVLIEREGVLEDT
ncbi:hypothetical protein [Trichococcus shcherbakoviae]|uniref:hypothetical protein n=1 Tax=Trichococcus shcherbakoviae TaxID=2094020 RepID=UPI0011C39C87|nr:hypothetical protein [Trichococcus shcherbakoviae]